jgi:hypothetical protein
MSSKRTTTGGVSSTSGELRYRGHPLQGEPRRRATQTSLGRPFQLAVQVACSTDEGASGQPYSAVHETRESAARATKIRRPPPDIPHARGPHLRYPAAVCATSSCVYTAPQPVLVHAAPRTQDDAIHKKRKRFKGNSKKNYVDGWVWA